MGGCYDSSAGAKRRLPFACISPGPAEPGAKCAPACMHWLMAPPFCSCREQLLWMPLPGLEKLRAWPQWLGLTCAAFPFFKQSNS